MTHDLRDTMLLALPLAIALLSRLAAAQQITNGDFSAGLDHWQTEGQVAPLDEQAILSENPTGLLSTLQQQFTITDNVIGLTFDYALDSAADATAGSQLPDSFTASLLDPDTLDPVLATTGFTDFFARTNTDQTEFDPAIVSVNNGTVTLDLTGLAPDTPALLVFDLIGQDDGLTTDITLDDVMLLLDVPDFAAITADAVNPAIGQALAAVATRAAGGDAAAQALLDALDGFTDQQIQQFVQQVNDSARGNTINTQVVIDAFQAYNAAQSTYLAARRAGQPHLARLAPPEPIGGPRFAHSRLTPQLLAAMLQAPPPADAEPDAGPAANTEDDHRGKDDALIRSGDVPRPSAAAGTLGAYAKVYGLLSDVGGETNRTGYDADAYGVQVGIDRQINAQWLVGLAFGYTRTNAVLDHGLGGVDVDTFRVGPYFSYHPRPWYLEGALTYGYNDHHATRRTNLGPARGDYHAHDIAANLSCGYTFQRRLWNLTPIASLQFVHFDRQAYTESGPGALAFGDDTNQSLHSRLGLRVSRLVKAEHLDFVPEVMVGWEHEYLDDDDPIDARFAAGSGSFNVNTAGPDADSVFVGAGLTVRFRHNLAAYARYDGTFSGQSNVHGLAAGIRLLF